MYQATIHHCDFPEFVSAADFPTVYRKTSSFIRFLERQMQMPVNAVIRDGNERVIALYTRNPDDIPPMMWDACSAVPSSYSTHWYEAIDDNSGAYYVESGNDWVRVEWCEPEPEPEKAEEPEEPKECQTYAEEIERIFCILGRIENW